MSRNYCCEWEQREEILNVKNVGQNIKANTNLLSKSAVMFID